MGLSKYLLAAVGMAVLAGGARQSMADIIVHSLTENTATGVYTYEVQFDAVADVQSKDGFVIYDFAGLTSWSISGGLSTAQFALTQGNTSNSLNAASSVDAIASTDALVNAIPFDSASVSNLSFSYVGPPVPFLGAATATLTINTSVLGGLTTSVDAAVDHSGISSNLPFAFSTAPVFVPAAAPEPASLSLLAIAGLPLLLRRKKRVG